MEIVKKIFRSKYNSRGHPDGEYEATALMLNIYEIVIIYLHFNIF